MMLTMIKTRKTVMTRAAVLAFVIGMVNQWQAVEQPMKAFITVAVKCLV